MSPDTRLMFVYTNFAYLTVVGGRQPYLVYYMYDFLNNTYIYIYDHSSCSEFYMWLLSRPLELFNQFDLTGKCNLALAGKKNRTPYYKIRIVQ